MSLMDVTNLIIANKKRPMKIKFDPSNRHHHNHRHGNAAVGITAMMDATSGCLRGGKEGGNHDVDAVLPSLAASRDNNNDDGGDGGANNFDDDDGSASDDQAWFLRMENKALKKQMRITGEENCSNDNDCTLRPSPATDTNLQDTSYISTATTRNSKTLETYWENMYQGLVAYKEKHGDLKVSWKSQLGIWVGTQRERYKKKKMPAERINRLNAIGFDWGRWRENSGYSGTSWEEMYKRLVAYQKDHGDANVPFKSKDNPQLGAWVFLQRLEYHKEKLSEERVGNLNAIGFEWTPPLTDADKKLDDRLAKEEESLNEWPAPPNNDNNDKTSETTIEDVIKKILNNSKKTAAKKPRLAVGQYESRWMEQYQRLVEYKKIHGDTKVPQKDPQLGIWVKKQRHYHRTNQHITEERIALLNSIGFDWGEKRRSWDDMYRRLVKYKEKHGNAKVPAKYDLDPQLGSWADKQRRAYRNKKMSDERVNLLNSISFNWGHTNNEWAQMYQRLVEYKNTNDDTRVPRTYKEDSQLGEWVNNQRKYYASDKMDKETQKYRVNLLNSLGFDWEVTWEKPQSLPWDEKKRNEFLERMKEAREKNKEEHDRLLGVWEETQRQVAVGWEEMYERLMEYKGHYGDTNVPRLYEQDSQLGKWVYDQRQAHKDKKLSDECVSRLNSIGFNWEMQRDGEEMFQRMLQIGEAK